MNSDIAIKVENVSKTFRIPHEKISSLRGAFVGMFRKNSFEEFQALDNVSFEVKKGEFFGIIGRNGSGKSTLLKILAGIYQADKGKVHVNGLISPFLELGIGFNPELSGRDNVYLNATILGMSRKEIDAKFQKIVDFSELEKFIDQKLNKYSSGMQVRLAFSVAIHANREILLMDEVLAVGDLNFQSKCLYEFNKYKEAGKTVILVTHDIATVQRYCDRAMLVRNGKIVKIGKSEDVGNEYMYQNMSDEEIRLMEEEKKKIVEEEKRINKATAEEKKIIEEKKKKQEEIERNKVAKIIKVEFLDKNGSRKNVFETGEDLSVRVYCRLNKDLEKINFGVAIFNQEGNYISGINTIFDKIDTQKNIEKGYYQVDYKDIQLNTNSYYIATSLVDSDFNLPYDRLLKSQYFKIVSKNKNEGIVQLKYSWS